MVKTCTRKSDGKQFAVKVITKSGLRGSAFQYTKTEVEVLKRVAGHPKGFRSCFVLNFFKFVC